MRYDFVLSRRHKGEQEVVTGTDRGEGVSGATWTTRAVTGCHRPETTSLNYTAITASAAFRQVLL